MANQGKELYVDDLIAAGGLEATESLGAGFEELQDPRSLRSQLVAADRRMNFWPGMIAFGQTVTQAGMMRFVFASCIPPNEGPNEGLRRIIVAEDAPESDEDDTEVTLIRDYFVNLNSTPQRRVSMFQSERDTITSSSELADLSTESAPHIDFDVYRSPELILYLGKAYNVHVKSQTMFSPASGSEDFLLRDLALIGEASREDLVYKPSVTEI